jgi:formate hydrogenlyase subunit 4
VSAPRASIALPLLAALSACATQAASAVAPTAPGFLFGLWHGFIFPVAWVLSLFLPEVSVYAVPNNGGWYDFGYFLGIVVFGVGARKSRIVYRNRGVRERVVTGTHTIRETE